MIGKRQPASIGALTLALLSTLLLLVARPAQAQTETQLWDFCPDGGTCADGSQSYSSLATDGTNFYGTTFDGGLSFGTVFEVSPNSIGGWNENVIYTFTGGTDGAHPRSSPLIFDSLGNLYGTAQYGGPNQYGVVFELSPQGANWTETVLYSFAGGTDGYSPVSGLIMDPSGNLYGTTLFGGVSQNGTVFELSLSGGAWSKQTIYEPSTGTGYAGLTMDAKGSVYGATPLAVFELSPNGDGGFNSTVIHTFTGTPKDGMQAEGTPVLQGGKLYGTTEFGGVENLGTVYELSPVKNGKWTEKILHSFKGGVKDGDECYAGIVFDPAGNIYGTTISGGKFGVGGDGIVFELVAPVGTGSYKEKILWNFNGTDGTAPFGGLILDSAGNLYGTTQVGGTYGDGTVFEVAPSGTAATTTTTLTSSLNPSTPGEAVTFTAAVTPTPFDGETITFKHGSTVLGTGLLSGGSASYTTSTLPVGTTSVEAVYGGDGDFDASTSNVVKQVVDKAAD